MRTRMFISLVVILTGIADLKAGTRLSRAAVDGDLNKVQSILKSGKEKVNDLDKWGWSALTWSVYYGHGHVAKYLLEEGADANFKTTMSYGRYSPGVTPCILAAYYGHSGILKDLIDHKANIKVKDANGKTARDYAKEFDFDKCLALLPE